MVCTFILAVIWCVPCQARVIIDITAPHLRQIPTAVPYFKILGSEVTHDELSEQLGFKFIKFVKPLRPDSEVVVRWKEKGTDMLDITCEHNDCVVVKGQLALSEKDIA